jgi:hypothetical protein
MTSKVSSRTVRPASEELVISIRLIPLSGG